MLPDVKTDYISLSSTTDRSDNRKSPTVIEPLQRASRASRRHDRSNIRISMPSEGEIVQAVTAYFSRLGFEELIKSEYEIKMGSAKYRADIVLCDAKKNFVAIAECELLEDLTYGHEPLKSFLRATKAPFGIVAPGVGENSWHFYQNSGANQIRLIEQSDFETGILKTLESPIHELTVM